MSFEFHKVVREREIKKKKKKTSNLMDKFLKIKRKNNHSYSPPTGGYPKGKDGPMGVIELYSNKYYVACGMGGILSCGLTHALVTPIDLVKCNLQGNPEVFTSTFQGFRYIYSGQAISLGYGRGMSGIMKGWGPTLVGYSVQGLFKYGLYEYFKHTYGELVGEENATRYRDLVYLAASSSAEFFADIAYCPFEALKVRIQTVPILPVEQWMDCPNSLHKKDSEISMQVYSLSGPDKFPTQSSNSWHSRGFQRQSTWRLKKDTRKKNLI